MKKSILVLVLIALAAAAGWSQIGIRNISSISVDVYFNDEEAAAANGGSVEKLALDLNQVILFRLTDWLSGELKVQRQDEEPFASLAPEGWHETTISVAPIFIASANYYIITRYGLGIGTGYERPAGEELEDTSVRGISHDLTVDANYETARTLANITLRGSLYPSLDYWFAVPSVGVRFVLPFGMGLMAKYFFSINSEMVESHAFLGEIDFPVSEAISLKVGGSGNVTLTDTTNSWVYTAIAGASFRITPALGIKYHAEFLGRPGRGPGIRNLISLDARF